MKNTSQLQPFESVIESQPILLELNPIQVTELKNLGRELSGSSSYWGSEGAEPPNASSIEITGTFTPGVFEVKVRNAIGTVALTGLTLSVEPKIPRNHFFFIANSAKVLGRFAPSAAHQSGSDHLAEVFARHFTDLVSVHFREGTVLDYAETSDFLSYPRGRIDAMKTLIGLRSGSVGVHCTIDEFSEENSFNRVVKHALNLLSAQVALSAETRRTCASLSNRLPVGPMTSLDLNDTGRNVPGRYAGLFMLAKALIAFAFSISRDRQKSTISFLLPTPLVMESGVRNLIRANIDSHWIVSPTAARKKLGPSRVTVNPDILLSKRVDGQTDLEFITGDVKYQLRKEDWKRANLYQAVTFATAYGAGKGFVIDFEPGLSPKTDGLTVGDVDLRNFAWNCEKDIEPSDSLKQLIDDIQYWIST